MLIRMRKSFALVLAALAVTQAAPAAAEDAAWTIVLHANDFVVGEALSRLHTRRSWAAGFDERLGTFDVAVRRAAVPIPAPNCRMDYLILTIPRYYPETPKQASVGERRTVYDALVALQGTRGGSMTVGVEAPPPLAEKRANRVELTACNLYFALPLSVQVSKP